MKKLNLKRLFVPFAAGILLCACGGNSASSGANSSVNSGAVNSAVNSAKTGVANSKENNSSKGENNSSCGCNDFGSQEQINKFFGIDSKKEDSQKAKKSK